jgi:lipopolysaccharide export system permease protein
LYADSGYIEQTPDTNYLIIKLKHGNRYEELVPENGSRLAKPMSQLNFRELEVSIPLTDFKLKRTDQNLFKEHHEMMNVWQIRHSLDTIQKKIERKHEGLQQQAKYYFFSRTGNLIKTEMKYHADVRAFYNNIPIADFNRCVENALNVARNSSAFVESSSDGSAAEVYKKIDYQVGWHSKINVCFACIVLFFVGAPLGAIIRKGGLGLPVVVSVIFFLAYFIFTEAFKSLTLEGVLEPWFGMWLPLFIFLPLGIFLTYKAATDSAIFDMSSYLAPFKKLFSRKKS